MSGEYSTLEKQGGVFVSSATLNRFKDFEQNYLSARDKEQRILSIEEIRKLPDVDPAYIHFKEWQIRKKNINRFLQYLGKKKTPQRILDIGCGNGFFTNLMSANSTVVGVDVNLTELKQASEAFPSDKITWYYLDILHEALPENKFDLVVFCASFQYFENPHALLQRCRELMGKGGEIHIIDSPFYSEEGKRSARLSSRNYYGSLGVSAMTDYYHHNTYEALKNQTWVFKYKPGGLLNKLMRRPDSPFPWIMIKNN